MTYDAEQPVCYIDHRETLAQVAQYGSAMTVLRRENISHTGMALYAQPDVEKLQREITGLRIELGRWKVKNP